MGNSELVNTNTNFVISNWSLWTQKNQNFLLDVYQPIIGSQAYMLYQYFLNFDSNSLNLSHSISDLCQKLSIDENHFFESINILNGIKLLRVYFRKTKNEYNFVLSTPKEPDQFFKNKNWVDVLETKIGLKNFESLKNKYINYLKPAESIELHVEFKDIFKISKSFSKKDLNFENIDVQLADKKLPSNIYAEFKNEINNLYINYNLSEKQIFRFILEAINGNNKFVLDVFKEKALKEFKKKELLKNDPKVSEISSVLINSLLDYQTVDKLSPENSKINEMEFFTPTEFVKLVFDKKNISNEELDCISKLQIDFGLKNSVINCLIDYCYLNNSGKFVPNFILKYGNTISQLNITTAEATMKYCKKAYQSRNKTKNDWKPMEKKYYNKKLKEVNHSSISVTDEKSLENLVSNDQVSNKSADCVNFENMF